MLKSIPGLIKKTIKFTGGVDESSPVTDMGEDCLVKENWRLSKDGKRGKKRLGSADQGLTEGKDIYGYTTYKDESDNFCKLLITESAINRKVGAAAWGEIHAFSSNIAHPVRPLEIQGKQFVINEVDSRFIHTDGNDYQIGIDAPTTLAKIYPEYQTQIENEPCESLSETRQVEVIEDFDGLNDGNIDGQGSYTGCSPWVVTKDASCTAEVSSNVLVLTDSSVSGDVQAVLTLEPNYRPDNGYIEIKYYHNVTDKTSFIALRDINNDVIFAFGFNYSGQIRGYEPNVGWFDLQAYSATTWYTVKVTFDASNIKYYVNTVEKESKTRTNGNAVYDIYFDTVISETGVVASFNDLDFTGDLVASTWTETNVGNMDTTQATFDSKSCFRFNQTGTPDILDYLTLTKSLAVSIGKRFKIEIPVYFDKFQHSLLENFYFKYQVDSSYQFVFASDGYRISVGKAVPGRVGDVGITLSEDTWYTLIFYVDAEVCSTATADVYINDTYYGTYPCTISGSGTAGDMTFYCSGKYVATDVYIDYLTIDETEEGSANGVLRKYAITYARSGNYGNESNPVKSIISSVTFKGSGINDLTSGGTYTGAINRAIQVEIDGTGATDTIRYSYDGGITWHTTTVSLTTTMYLNYGITLTWGAKTGHTSGDYWVFNCQTMSVRAAAGELVQITTIPTSSDSQVDRRRIYRSVAEGTTYFWLTSLDDNTATSYNEEIPDSGLGTEAEEDHDVMPDGKFSVWWDNRLWVSGDNIVYDSDIDNPEAFDTDNRYIIIRKGEQGDDITQMVDYKDALYVFKRNSIFVIISQPDGNYGRHLLTEDIGCVAPWSMVKVNNLLMFLSHKGWEIYNGTDIHSLRFSIPLKRTLASIDTSEYEFISSCHNRAYSEVLLSLPDRTGGASACTPVYNYASNKFYIFSYHKTPSFFAEARDSNDKIQTYYGTRDGYLLLHDSGYQDGGNNITATMRKGWYDSKQYADIRRIDLEYECPTNMKIVCNLYVNMDKDVARTKDMTGKSPSATDIELRRPIYDFAELGLRAKWVSIEFTNNQNVGGDLKLNECALYYKPRAIKGRIVSD